MSSQPHKKNLCVRDAVLSGDYLVLLVHVNKGQAKSVVILDEDDHICFRLEGRRQNKKKNHEKKKIDLKRYCVLRVCELLCPLLNNY